VSNDFEKEKICYEQNYLQFRSLNNVMWQVPIIAMTLTGGLWFGADGTEDIFFKTILLFLAAIGNFGLVIVLTRTRFVMGKYLDKIEGFSKEGFVLAAGDTLFTSKKAVVRTFSILLILSGLLSFLTIAHIHGYEICQHTESAQES